MMPIGFRTLKTSIGTGVSIFAAEWLELSFSLSAGILTILSIQPTKKRSLKSALNRTGACFAGLLVSALVFSLIGFHPWSLTLLLLILIPLLVRLKLQEGLVTSMVIILHLYATHDLTLTFLFNEIQVILIGIGVALLMNFYMPSKERVLKEYRYGIEDLFRILFKELASFVRHGDTSWSGKELMETAEMLEKAKDLAIQTNENQLLRNYDEQFKYFKMRERQFERMERMLPLVSSIDLHVVQCHDIADLFDYLQVHLTDDPNIIYQHWKEIREKFQRMDLPHSREEFESRASLFALLNEMEQFILIEMEGK